MKEDNVSSNSNSDSAPVASQSVHRQQEHQQGNKLIAEFMGLSTAYIDGTKLKVCISPRHSEWVDLDTHCIYHRSWDWLMPVVEKIAADFTTNIHSFPGSGFTATIKEGNFRRGHGETNSAIESAWLAVVEFIQWYNNQGTGSSDASHTFTT